jgi:hypothetical protein
MVAEASAAAVWEGITSLFIFILFFSEYRENCWS